MREACEFAENIVFLTTNRVGHFDDAFMSRIHVVIFYDRQSPQDQRKICKQFFNKLTDDRQDFIITRDAKNSILEEDFVTKMGWNGREIRNGKYNLFLSLLICTPILTHIA